MANGLLHRRRMMQASGGGLPAGWSFVESITLERTKYFRTDYTPNSDTRAYFVGSINGNSTCLYEVRNRSNVLYNRSGIFAYSNRLYSCYGTENYNTLYTFGDIAEFVLDRNLFYIDGFLMKSFTPDTFVCATTVTFGLSRQINADNTETNNVANSAGVTFKEMQFSENGTIIKNYKPILYQDGVTYALWEEISKTILYHT